MCLLSDELRTVCPGFSTGEYFFLQLYFIYLFIFWAALGLRCCAQAFSTCGEQGLRFVAVCGLLIAVASLIVEHGLWAHGLQ